MIAATDRLDRIAFIFTHKLNIDVLALDSDLFENGILDSLTLVDLLAALEAEFEFHLPPGELDIDQFRSLDRIARFVTQYVPGREAAIGIHQTAA
jgi:acyl carrier protein